MRTRAALALSLALAAAAPARGDEGGYGKTRGLIPGVLLGPKLNLVALPPGAGLEAKLLGNSLGLSFDLGLIPPTTISNVKASYLDWNLGARWYPWAGRFYLGAALGNRTFKGTATDGQTGLEAKATVKGTYLAPELGWKFVADSGLFAGIDLGYQLILSKSTTLDIPGGIDAAKAHDVTDAADKIGKIGLPILTLVQVGYLF